MTTATPGSNSPTTAFPAVADTGTPCWFSRGTNPAPATSLIVSWAAYADGVAAFTDAKVHVGGATLIEIVTAGVYILDVSAECTNAADNDETTVKLALALNDDSVGPLSALVSEAVVAPAGAATVRIGCPVQLAVGALLKATVTSTGDPVDLGLCTFTLVRL